MKRFKFLVPCKSVWVVVTDAKNEDEAWKQIKERKYFKLYDYEGDTASGKTELINTEQLQGERK